MKQKFEFCAHFIINFKFVLLQLYFECEFNNKSFEKQVKNLGLSMISDYRVQILFVRLDFILLIHIVDIIYDKSS